MEHLVNEYAWLFNIDVFHWVFGWLLSLTVNTKKNVKTARLAKHGWLGSKTDTKSQWHVSQFIQIAVTKYSYAHFRKLRVIGPCKDPGSWQLRTFLCSPGQLVLYTVQMALFLPALPKYCPFRYIKQGEEEKEGRKEGERKERRKEDETTYLRSIISFSLMVKKLSNFNSWKYSFNPLNKICSSLFHGMDWNIIQILWLHCALSKMQSEITRWKGHTPKPQSYFVNHLNVLTMKIITAIVPLLWTRHVVFKLLLSHLILSPILWGN